MGTDVVAILDEALGLGDVIVVVRGPGSIAEVMGDLGLRRSGEWLMLGQEGGSHVHLKAADLASARFVHLEGRNAALKFLDGSGAEMVQVSFRGTNPGRAERYDAARVEAVRARFGHWGGK
jgi:putative heme iron utilization protein